MSPGDVQDGPKALERRGPNIVALRDRVAQRATPPRPPRPGSGTVDARETRGAAEVGAPAEGFTEEGPEHGRKGAGVGAPDSGDEGDRGLDATGVVEEDPARNHGPHGPTCLPTPGRVLVCLEPVDQARHFGARGPSLGPLRFNSRKTRR